MKNLSKDTLKNLSKHKLVKQLRRVQDEISDLEEEISDLHRSEQEIQECLAALEFQHEPNPFSQGCTRLWELVQAGKARVSGYTQMLLEAFLEGSFLNEEEIQHLRSRLQSEFHECPQP
jgi:septal ring factor EnvC (AmiA/AmiB activator)